MSKTIFNLAKLNQDPDLKKELSKDFSIPANNDFAFMAPKAYLDKIDWNKPDDPLKTMVWPNEKELDKHDYQLNDPIGDEPHLGVPNLVHRYPDRALLLLTNHCQINCRFCFRRDLTHHANLPNLDQIFSYLEKHSEIREIIFSGGDPLTFSPSYLRKVYDKLSPISHIKIFRFHSRIPAVNPNWLDQKYLDFFDQVSQKHSLFLVVHINHFQEVDQNFIDLCRQLKKTGLTLLSQTVLLRGVNDDVQILSKLMTKLVECGVKPYYLHHPDLVKGTDHFRLGIEAGLKIYTDLKKSISGVAVPGYVLDLPGGKGKVSVESLNKIDDKTYQAINFKNEIVTYVDPSA